MSSAITNNQVLIRGRNLGGCLRVYSSGTKYVSIPHNALLSPAVTDDFSISAWINLISAYGTNPQSLYGIFSKRDGQNSLIGYSLQLYEDSNFTSFFRFVVSGYPDYLWLDSTNKYNLRNTWNHIAAVKSGYSNTDFNLYLNGALIDTTVLNNTLTSSSIITNAVDALINNISSTNTQYPVNSYQTKTCYFNKALSDTEVMALYKCQGIVPSALKSSLVLFLESNIKNGKVLSDVSGNALDGNLINYTDAETANAGQPQSGNTAWNDSYTLTPYTVL